MEVVALGVPPVARIFNTEAQRHGGRLQVTRYTLHVTGFGFVAGVGTHPHSPADGSGIRPYHPTPNAGGARNPTGILEWWNDGVEIEAAE